MNKDKIVSSVLTSYIKLVAKTSKIEIENLDLVKASDKQYLMTFWHGYSYCLYPAIPNLDMAVITTENKRGDFIADMCRAFDALPLRVPDESQGDNPLFKLAREMKTNSDKHVALACDGPLGPQHYPKDFAFVLSEMTKRPIVPLSVKSNRSIVLFKRWDKFRIPTPFSRIKVKFGQPLTVEKEDRLESYATIRESLIEAMERPIDFNKKK